MNNNITKTMTKAVNDSLASHTHIEIIVEIYLYKNVKQNVLYNKHISRWE